MHIEEQYQSFLQTLDRPLNASEIDFFGINLYDRSKDSVAFKIYYAQKHSSCSTHPLALYLQQHDMLRYMSEVKDTLHESDLRIDLALKNRTDANMEALFSMLYEENELFAGCERSVRSLAGMCITGEQDCNLASLYHLGSIEQGEKKLILKFHFFTRWCLDHNRPGKNSEYRDVYYLNYLRDTGIAEYRKITEISAAVLKSCGGHLLTAGMDVGNAGYRKYKLYVKHPAEIYQGLMEHAGVPFSERIREVIAWNKKHPEYEAEIVAFCLDTTGIFSINLYYGMR